jgi:hypothetical protein
MVKDVDVFWGKQNLIGIIKRKREAIDWTMITEQFIVPSYNTHTLKFDEASCIPTKKISTEGYSLFLRIRIAGFPYSYHYKF